MLAEEIADDLRSALEQIESVLADLQPRAEMMTGKRLDALHDDGKDLTPHLDLAKAERSGRGVSSRKG